LQRHRPEARQGRAASPIVPRPPGAERGFTLLEIAIVLLIAGLLFAAIMKGHALVVQARGKQLVHDLNAVHAAAISYHDRYKTWPGDDPGAATRWGLFNARSGNGDGVVTGSYNDLFAGDPGAWTDGNGNESMKFWWHLRISGFALGPPTGAGSAAPPMTRVGGILGVQTGGPGLFAGLMACVSNVPAPIAELVDTQLDDQLPGNGTLRARRQRDGQENPPLASTDPVGVNLYVDDGATRYVLCRAMQDS